MKSDSLSDLLAWKPPEVKPIISNGILLPETRMVLFGRYDSWKSMIAIDMGFSVAQGLPWLSFSTKQSKVLITQTEIPRYVYRQRVEKYCKGHGCYPDNIYFWTEVGLKLDTAYGIAALDRELNEVKPTLLIIDPIYSIMSGGISDSTDVSKLLDNLDMVKTRYNIAIILIGHSGKATFDSSGDTIDRGADALLGSSYFQDWVDTIAKVSANSHDKISIMFQKTRHAEEIVMPVNAEVDRNTLGWKLV